MALIKSFEEMESWKKARVLNKLIYIETRKSGFSGDFALRDQIRRSSISIMSNIAEGFERGNYREFRHFLRIAKGSAGELRSQLYIASDLDYLNHALFNDCEKRIVSISKLLAGFIKDLEIKILQTNTKTSKKNSVIN